MSTEAAALPRPSIIPPSLKPLALLIGIAAAFAAGVVIVLWSKEPTYSLLYGNLGQQDAAQIAASLDTNNIPYKIDGGTIHVPGDSGHHGRRDTGAAGPH